MCRFGAMSDRNCKVVFNFAFGFPKCLLDAFCQTDCIKEIVNNKCSHVETCSPDPIEALHGFFITSKYIQTMKASGYTVQWIGPYGMDKRLAYVSETQEILGDCRKSLVDVGIDEFDAQDLYYSNLHPNSLDELTMSRAYAAVAKWEKGTKHCLIVNLFGCHEFVKCRPDKVSDKQIPLCATRSIGGLGVLEDQDDVANVKFDTGMDMQYACTASVAISKFWRHKHTSCAPYDDDTFRCVLSHLREGLRRIEHGISSIVNSMRDKDIWESTDLAITSTHPINLRVVGDTGTYLPGSTHSFAIMRMREECHISHPIPHTAVSKFMSGELTLDASSSFGNTLTTMMQLDKTKMYSHLQLKDALEFNCLMIRSVIDVDGNHYEVSLYFSVDAVAMHNLSREEYSDWRILGQDKKLLLFTAQDREWKCPAVNIETYENCVRQGMEMCICLLDDNGSVGSNLCGEEGWLAGHASFVTIQEFVATIEQAQPTIRMWNPEVQKNLVRSWQREKVSLEGSLPVRNETLLDQIDVSTLPDRHILTVIKAQSSQFHLPGIIHPDILFSLAKGECAIRCVDGTTQVLRIQGQNVIIGNCVVDLRSFDTCTYMGKQFGFYVSSRMAPASAPPLMLTSAYPPLRESMRRERDFDEMSTSSRSGSYTSTAPSRGSNIRRNEQMRNMRRNY